jgi:hypothetical protein
VTVKLALDVWYELWENAASESRPSLDQHPDEGDHHYPWLEDGRAWNRDTRPRSLYYTSLVRSEIR